MRGLLHFELQLLANFLVLFVVIDGARCWAWWNQSCRRIARFRGAGVLVALMGLLLTAGLGAAVHTPTPSVHDEFAYLLTADTFTNGRLTNPTHSMWEFFESPHLIHTPSYQAKYPPGQALTLAAGWALLGHPIFGVWIIYSLACAAVFWMLRAFVPRHWALVGALLCLGNSCMTLGLVQSYTRVWGPIYSHGWGQTYWGGGLAMLGGALLFGGLGRVAQHPRISGSLAMGVGAAILANSRMYEGLVTSVPLAVVFCGVLLRRLSRGDYAGTARMTLPALCVLCATAIWIMIYNQHVTGDPLRLPYQVWKEQYSGPSLFSTLYPAGVESNQRYLGKLLIEWEFFVRLLLSAPLLASVRRIRYDRWVALAGLCCTVTLLSVLFQNTRGNPHYLAPVVAPFILLIVSGLRELRGIRIGEVALGRAFVRATLLVYLLSFAYVTWSDWITQPVKRRWNWTLDRSEIEQSLAATGRQHVVIVQYNSLHDWHHEWVYNGADIDASPVVWAHDLGEERNEDLLEYFSDRKCWLVEVGHAPGPLTPLPAKSESATAASSSSNP